MDFGELRGNGELLGTTPRDRAHIGLGQSVGGDDLPASRVDLVRAPRNAELQ